MSNPNKPHTPEEQRRSRSLDLALAHVENLAEHLRNYRNSDAAKALRQKDRHALCVLAKKKLAEAEARIMEVH